MYIIAGFATGQIRFNAALVGHHLFSSRMAPCLWRKLIKDCVILKGSELVKVFDTRQIAAIFIVAAEWKFEYLLYLFSLK